MSAPPTRADLIAGSGDHRCGSRGRCGRISRTQRRANGRGYISRQAGGVGCRWMLRQFVVKTLPSTGFPDGHRACVGPSDHR